MTTPDYPDFQTPQAHATQISLTGTPLLHGYNTLISNQAFALAGNQTVTTGQIAVAKPGFQAEFSLTSPAGVTAPWVLVQVRWFDITGLIQMWREDWIIPGTVAGNVGIQAMGPSRGAMFTLSFVNQDATHAQTVNATWLESTHHIPRSDWRTGGLNSNPTGFTWAPGANPPGNILASTDNLSIGAGATNKYILPLFAGPVALFAELLGSTSLTIDPAIGGGVGPGHIYDFAASAQVSVLPTLVTLPRQPCMLTLSNSGAGAAVFGVSMICQEFVS